MFKARGVFLIGLVKVPTLRPTSEFCCLMAALKATETYNGEQDLPSNSYISGFSGAKPSVKKARLVAPLKTSMQCIAAKDCGNTVNDVRENHARASSSRKKRRVESVGRRLESKLGRGLKYAPATDDALNAAYIGSPWHGFTIMSRLENSADALHENITQSYHGVQRREIRSKGAASVKVGLCRIGALAKTRVIGLGYPDRAALALSTLQLAKAAPAHRSAWPTIQRSFRTVLGVVARKDRRLVDKC
ncbi:hypothetical protein BDZ89DRAFT_1046731 [Hymenopellis radicata]|nr:hypothetical protein BDZ89DRAFT_1046731 [Hymenopellis radicata]